MTRIELENQLVNEVHTLPIESMELMLKLAVLIKQIHAKNTIDLAGYLFDATKNTSATESNMSQSFSQKNMIEELLENPIKIAGDVKPFSRDEIYASRKD